MPNADTMGNFIRKELLSLKERKNNVFCIESFGAIGYLSCMKHCTMLLGNTSSGFVEASFFPKYVINLGKRQFGRIITENIRNCELKKELILEAINAYDSFLIPKSINIYGNGKAAEQIVYFLKSLHV
jgi:GDP/UDP-N,N'-diacetylbacillosamine 2-epimerase (hydrolysing)